jgi:alpha-amylase/alpha-mannosidase (GH57 family)
MNAPTFSTAIQKVNYPEGKRHGQFFIVGTIPSTCYDHTRKESCFYETEIDTLQAILNDPWIDANPTHTIQRADCSKVIRLQ